MQLINKQRLTDEEGRVYADIKLNKADVKDAVKSILKDLSAQLRINGLKVQESHVPALARMIAEEVLIESQRSARRRQKGSKKQKERWAAEAEKGAKMSTGVPYQSKASAPEWGQRNKTGRGDRVKATAGQVDAGRAVGGKLYKLVMKSIGGDIKDKKHLKRLKKDIQPQVQNIIMKVVKPYLQKYLQGKDIKLRESTKRELEVLITRQVYNTIVKDIVNEEKRS